MKDLPGFLRRGGVPPDLSRYDIRIFVEIVDGLPAERRPPATQELLGHELGSRISAAISAISDSNREKACVRAGRRARLAVGLQGRAPAQAGGTVIFEAMIRTADGSLHIVPMGTASRARTG